MPQTAMLVGPQDNGRAMSLEDFEFAEVKKGHLYELSRGVLVVSDIPDLPHFAQFSVMRDRLVWYKIAYPGQILEIGGGAECKLLMRKSKSERHPDIANYKTAPPKGENPWRTWIPDIVIEIVSPGSDMCDYVEKRREYLETGVKEYWIVDAQRREMLALRRQRGKWTEQVIQENETYSTKLLPGFTLELGRVFAAADAAQV